MAEFFTEVTERIPLRGSRQRQPAGVPLVRRRPRRRRPADGGPPPLRRLLLALVQLGRLRHLRRRHARPPVAPDVRPGGRPARRGRPEDGRRVRVLRQARRAVLLLPRPRHRARGRVVQGVGGAARRDGRPRRRAPGAHRRRSCCGARPTCSPTPATRPARRPTPTPRCSPTPRPRSPTASRRPTASAATTTCCGAGARATTRCSTPTCGASSTSSARFLSMVVEHKHRIGFTGHDPHRAQAVRADQAPVRLRRRRGARLPAALRPRRRDQGQHRGQPRHAVGPRLRPRGRRRRQRRHLRLDRRQRRRRPARLGRRPLPGVGRADGARHARDPPRPAGSRRAG